MKLILGIAAKIFDRLNTFLAAIATVLLALLMLSITYAVVTRYFLNFTTIGLFEIWEYSLLYITFLGAAWLLTKEGHVSVDVVLNQLKPKAQAVLNTITSLIGAVVCFVLAWYGTSMTLYSIQAGREILQGELYPPEFIILMIIPIGSCLLFVQFLRRSYKFFKSSRVPPTKEQDLI
ncbi:TRAP transporter small permease [Chloroflexota bacterium]